MAQPGTGARAMEKPVQTSLVHADSGDSSEDIRSSTGFLWTQLASSCSSQSCGLPDF
ncbi:Hypothetical predicted protein [Lynx pardinus]|uniref:Uncharacterized protein n=1 Tax=Lynx pardinus TaxID=191816 RepID=A0A485NWP2_LYNPA|nr:Hypothetical predicted protein [Lynx pardinus]